MKIVSVVIGTGISALDYLPVPSGQTASLEPAGEVVVSPQIGAQSQVDHVRRSRIAISTVVDRLSQETTFVDLPSLSPEGEPILQPLRGDRRVVLARGRERREAKFGSFNGDLWPS
jgi:hypothetical protein